MPFALRVFALYFVFVGMSGYFMLDLVVKEIKPGVRQSSEEVLFDTAQLLAQLVAPHLAEHNPQSAGQTAQQPLPPQLQQVLASYGKHRTQALIWGVEKASIPHRIYITDAAGIIIYDSANQDLGKDYSRWNDVYLTLKGQYGARSSRTDPNDENSTVMHVAAAVRHQDQIIGVLTIAKPNHSMQPFIDRTQAYLTQRGLLLMLLGLAVGALLAWRLQQGLNRLETYANQLSAGERVGPPKFRMFFEFANLAQALDKMRQTLAGRAYAERYVQTLTHELKSPLTAIQAASELLQQPLPDVDRQRFARNIQQQTERLHQLIEQLLQLSELEQRQHLLETKPLDLAALCQQAVQQRQGRIDQQQWQLQLDLTATTIEGDALLLQQSIGHLLDNALDFADKGATVTLDVQLIEQQAVLTLFNQGPAIPNYALPRLTERFYSLPRPGKQQKSTGLGLNFVAEVVKLHQGELQLENVKRGQLSGVLVTVRLPLQLQ
ncbi:two-component system sensor histidine kinase CreC [Rheinheimera riviphila]|uniref:histidine kinase n=1 Tax=Rheinheimera riviphila TaxID=1834037 RepID=A0A437R1I4_9GAMM|nr:two-component system sensor histidine kinase CreC [Rheinheimera riviphila]